MTDSRLNELHCLLQKALELELFTIPPYLTALYSIRKGHNREATQIIQGVVMEEMLHATLIANVMNAVGAKPRVSPDIVNREEDGRWHLEVRPYPSRVPHVDLDVEVSLERFSKTAIKVFRKIEEPEDPETWCSAEEAGRFASIGHFYNVLLEKLIALSVDLGEANVFVGGSHKQMHRNEYYGAGGNVMPVRGLSDAKDVITQVAQQGEGRRKISNLTGDQERFGQPKEVAHYFRFEEILAGRLYDRDDDVKLDPAGRELVVDWRAVYPMRSNPDPSSARPEGIAKLLKDFDLTYRDVLKSLHDGFNGRQEALGQAVGEMYRLRYQSTALMEVGISPHETHGPPFWYVELTASQPVKP